MAAIELTTAILRTLAEGVTRLRKGDEGDCDKADATDAALRALGFCLCHYDYIPRDFEMLISHFDELGAEVAVLTAAEKDEVLALADKGTLSMMCAWVHIKNSGPEARSAMGEKLREIRIRKGLPEFAA